MRRALLILFLGLASHSCDQKYCLKQVCIKEFKSINLKTLQAKRIIDKKECKLMNEWLDRESMGHFLKNHISLEHYATFSVDKTL
jgi:hypothetical protein